MQAGTTPKKRTNLNGRAALKLMRLDGAELGRKRHRMPVVARPRWQVVVVSNRGL